MRTTGSFIRRLGLQIVLVLIVGAAAALAPGRARAAETEEFYWKGALASGKTLEIRGINGPIRAEPAPGREVEVRAVKKSRRCDPSVVRIEQFTTEDGMKICAIYPGRRDSSSDPCEGQHNDDDEHWDCDIRVSFVVKVPAGVRFLARTVNGDIEALQLDGAVEAATVNGSIELVTDGYAEASTVNGEIDVRMDSKGWPGSLDFRTVNGSITIEMPSGVNANLKAQTMHGSIESDFPLEVTGAVKKNKVRGTIGKGGPELSLATLNGSIVLRRARS